MKITWNSAEEQLVIAEVKRIIATGEDRKIDKFYSIAEQAQRAVLPPERWQNLAKKYRTPSCLKDIEIQWNAASPPGLGITADERILHVAKAMAHMRIKFIRKPLIDIYNEARVDLKTGWDFASSENSMMRGVEDAMMAYLTTLCTPQVVEKVVEKVVDRASPIEAWLTEQISKVVATELKNLGQTLDDRMAGMALKITTLENEIKALQDLTLECLPTASVESTPIEPPASVESTPIEPSAETLDGTQSTEKLKVVYIDSRMSEPEFDRILSRVPSEIRLVHEAHQAPNKNLKHANHVLMSTGTKRPDLWKTAYWAHRRQNVVEVGTDNDLMEKLRDIVGKV